MSVLPTGPCSSFALFTSDFWLFTLSFRPGAFQSNVAFYNGDLLIGQAVELIDYLINQCIGPLDAGEQGIEFGKTSCKLAIQRFLETSA